MHLIDITKGKYNRDSLDVVDVRMSVIFHRQGTTTSEEGLYEYKIQQIYPDHFNLQCLSCSKYIQIKHRGFEFHKNEEKSLWKLGPNVTESDLLNAHNYTEVYHNHSKRCQTACNALHTNDCIVSKFRPSKRRFRTGIVRQAIKVRIC